MRLGISWKKFQSIFPIQSLEFFTPTLNACLSDSTVYLLTTYLDEIKTDEDSFATPNEQSTDINLYFQAEETGGFIACLEYTNPSEDGTNLHCVAIVVGEFPPLFTEDSPVSIVPHYLLVGQKRTENNEVVFVPDTLGYKILDAENNNEPILIDVDITEGGNFSEGLCYAADCLSRILAGFPLDTHATQKWCDANQVDDQTLENRIDFITTRSEHNLSMEVKKLKKAWVKEAVTQFHMPPSLVLQ